MDRISRLNTDDWEKLKYLIGHKGLKVVSLDLPTSYQFMNRTDEFTERMLAAFNSMMLDMLAAVARKDYEGHCCKVSDEAAFCLIQRPYISKTLLTRRISPRGSP